MSSGKYASEDELIRAALQALTEEEEDLEAIRESIDEWHSGYPGVSLEEAFASICAGIQSTGFHEIPGRSASTRTGGPLSRESRGQCIPWYACPGSHRGSRRCPSREKGYGVARRLVLNGRATQIC